MCCPCLGKLKPLKMFILNDENHPSSEFIFIFHGKCSPHSLERDSWCRTHLKGFEFLAANCWSLTLWTTKLYVLGLVIGAWQKSHPGEVYIYKNFQYELEWQDLESLSKLPMNNSNPSRLISNTPFSFLFFWKVKSLPPFPKRSGWD